MNEVDIVMTTDHIGFTAALKYNVKNVKYTVIKSLSQVTQTIAI